MDIAGFLANRHARLTAELGEHVDAVADERPDIDLEVLRLFLDKDLLAQIHAEELHLAPLVRGAMHDGGALEAAMQVDIDYIKQRINAIDRIVFSLETAPTEDVEFRFWAELRALLIGLSAVTESHVRKLAEVYVPILKRILTEELQERLIADLEARARLEALMP
jgi:hypothetical protein